MASKFLIRVKEVGAKAAGKSLNTLSKSMGSLARAGKTAALGTAALGVAAVVAGSKAVKMAGEFDKLEGAFDNLNKSAGFGEGSLGKYRKALDGTVSSSKMMEMANNAMLLGIADSNDQMAEMFDVAQRLGAAVGEDAAFGVNSLVTGMGRQSVLMLDNLGIMVDTEEANKKYAKANKKNVKDLTDVEKKQAFNNETMVQANLLVGKLGDEQLTTADKMSKLKAQMEDGAIAIGQKLAPAFGEALDMLSGLADIDMVATLKNHFNSISQFQQAVIESFKMVFDSDIMLKALTGIKDGFILVFNNVSSVLQSIGGYLFEPLLMGGKIIAVKIGNFFIDMINGIKEQMNKVAGLFGGEGFDLTPKISEEGLSMASTRMGEFIGVLTDDTKVSNEELASGLTDIWSGYADGIVVQNEKIKESTKGVGTTSTESGEVVIEQQTAYGEQLSASLNSITGMTSAIKEKASAEMAEMKSTSKFKNASQKQQEAMESALLKKQAGEKSRMAKLDKTAKLGSATMNTYEAVSKAWAQTGIFGAVSGAIALAAGLAQVSAIASTPIPSFAQGGDFVTNGSQMIMVGDNPSGRERVQVTPLDSGSEPTGGGGSVVVNFSGNVMSQNFIEDEAIPMIKEAIRRGADIGVA